MTVDQQIADIKAHMPEVYQSIKDKADAIGKTAYAFVRRGLRGEPNCFFAFERGRKVGTPFNIPEVMDSVAGNMVRWGVECGIVWPLEAAHPPVGTPATGIREGNSTPAVAPVAGLGKSERNGEQLGGVR